MPGRAQALSNACCALPPSLEKQNTLIEQSNILLKQSVNIINHVYVQSLLHCDTIIDTKEYIIGGAMEKIRIMGKKFGKFKKE